MEELLTGVLQSTFSVAVAAFLLVRMESRLDKLAEAIAALRLTIEREPKGRAEAGADA